MTPAGTSNEVDVQNEWEENTHIHEQYTSGERENREKPIRCNTAINSICITVVMLGYDWWLCMVINISVAVGFSPTLYC